MPWKCPGCGAENLDDALTSHAVEALGCGYIRFPAGVALVSDLTFKEVELRISTTFGNTTLKRLEDPGVRFASREQFRIEKREEQGGWAVVNISWATNPTYLNGNPISSEGALLKEGDKLSIKGKHLHITIRLII